MNAPAAGAPTAVERFLALVGSHLKRGSLEKLVLARPRGGEPGVQRVILRPFLLRGERALSATTRHATRDVVKNFPEAEGLDWLRGVLGNASFGHAHLFAADEEAQLLLSKKGSATLRQAPRATAVGASGASGSRADSGAAVAGSGGAEAAETTETGETASTDAPAGPDATTPAVSAAATAAVPTAAAATGAVFPNAGIGTEDRGGSRHDRPKRRHVDIAAPFLVELGVTDAAHRLIPSMARKWKQIDKFVEIFEHALAASPLAGTSRPIRVADFGAGKGYLTFAVHDHLRRRPGAAAPEVVGVEWREDLVRLCNDAAARLGLGGQEGLRFVQGDVASHRLDELDVMIALHACDTATDHAIHRGVRAGASIIMTSPCCHKELRPQMHGPSVLRPLLRHGIHLGQEAEMLTDALRALLLEAEGYDTQVFEFVSLEHTNKNKMILAVKRGPAVAGPATVSAERRERIRAQVRELMGFYGIEEQTLERLLRQQ